MHKCRSGLDPAARSGRVVHVRLRRAAELWSCGRSNAAGRVNRQAWRMNLVKELYRLGGVTKRETLIARTSRREVDRALRNGDILRDSRGRYALPVANNAVRAANALAGVASHRSAAMWWGWQQKASDHRPEVTVPRNRRVPPERRHGMTVHWSDLERSDVEGLVTSRPRTLIDCLRSLPFDEGLAIADSALRNG